MTVATFKNQTWIYGYYKNKNKIKVEYINFIK